MSKQTKHNKLPCKGRKPRVIVGECMPLKVVPQDELLMYYWYLFYSHQNINNAWAKISSCIPSSSPTTIKNLFYTNAKTTLKKIIKRKPYFEDTEDKIRRAFYVYCAVNCLLHPTVGKRNYFQKLVNETQFSYKNFTNYADELGINWAYDVLIGQVQLLINEFKRQDCLLCSLRTSPIVFPFQSGTTLPPLPSLVQASVLTFEEKSTIMYFIHFPRRANCNGE